MAHIIENAYMPSKSKWLQLLSAIFCRVLQRMSKHNRQKRGKCVIKIKIAKYRPFIYNKRKQQKGTPRDNKGERTHKMRDYR